MQDRPLSTRHSLTPEKPARQTLAQIYESNGAVNRYHRREKYRQFLSSGECPLLEESSLQRLDCATEDPIFRAAFQAMQYYLGSLYADSKDFDDKLRQVTQMLDLAEAERLAGSDQSPGVVATLGAYPTPNFEAAKKKIKRARANRVAARERCRDLQNGSSAWDCLGATEADRNADVLRWTAPFGDTGDVLLVAKLEFEPLDEFCEALRAASKFDNTPIHVATLDELEAAKQRQESESKKLWSRFFDLDRKVPRPEGAATLRNIMWVKDDLFARRAVADCEIIVLARRGAGCPGEMDVPVSYAGTRR